MFRLVLNIPQEECNLKSLWINGLLQEPQRDGGSQSQGRRGGVVAPKRQSVNANRRKSNNDWASITFKCLVEEEETEGTNIDMSTIGCSIIHLERTHMKGARPIFSKHQFPPSLDVGLSSLCGKAQGKHKDTRLPFHGFDFSLRQSRVHHGPPCAISGDASASLHQKRYGESRSTKVCFVVAKPRLTLFRKS